VFACVTHVGCLPASSLTRISSLHVVCCIVYRMVAALVMDSLRVGDMAPAPFLEMEVHLCYCSYHPNNMSAAELKQRLRLVVKSVELYQCDILK